MNFLDILIAIPLCFFIYKGWRRGLIFEITSLAGIIVGVWACVHFSTWVAETLNIQGDTGVLIAFFITFAAVVALAYFLGKAIEGIFKMVKLNFLNKLFGALLGMAKCLCVISVLLNFILMIDTHQSILTPKAKEESVLYKPSYRIGNKLTISLKNYIAEKRAELAEQQESTNQQYTYWLSQRACRKEKHVCPLDCCGCMWRTAFPDSFCLFRAGLLPNHLMFLLIHFHSHLLSILYYTYCF